MTRYKKIIGEILIMALALQPAVPLTYAASVEEICAEKQKAANYAEIMKLWDDAETKDQNAYQDAYDAGQKAHHEYEGCIFNFVEATVLQSDAATDSGTMDANMLNTGGIPLFSSAIDFVSPDEACLSSDALKKVLQDSDPMKISEPVLKEQSAYRDFLVKLGDKFSSEGIQTGNEGEELSTLQLLTAKSINLGTLERQRKLEIQSSLMAIDLMFTAVKELRLAFVMHVHFQCTLKYLEQYRRALADLRVMIEALPSLLKDASITQ